MRDSECESEGVSQRKASTLHAGLRQPLAVPAALLGGSHIKPHPQSVSSWGSVVLTQPKLPATNLSGFVIRTVLLTKIPTVSPF